MKQTDYYQILALERNTSDEEIKRAYRRLAFQYHPDQNPMDEEGRGEVQRNKRSLYCFGGS